MDLSNKLAIGIIITVITGFCFWVWGFYGNTESYIKQGYTQQNITYCSAIYTKTIWVKN